MNYKLLRPDVFPLEPIKLGDAGFLIRSPYDFTIFGQGREIIETGIAIKTWPDARLGILAEEEHLALHGLKIHNNIILPQHEEIRIIFFNHTLTHYLGRRGDVIARLFIIPFCRVRARLV